LFITTCIEKQCTRPLRRSFSQAHSYSTLAINLKLFAQFEYLRGYLFKAQIA